MLAPNHVSAPAAIHTSSIPLNVGTARLTSDGWTKIEDPTIVPTTMAVACVRPIERASFAVTGRMLSGLRLRWQIDSRLRRLVHRPNGRDRVGVGRRLVGPVPLHAREAPWHAARA